MASATVTIDDLARAGYAKFRSDHLCDGDGNVLFDEGTEWEELTEWQRDEYRSIAEGIVSWLTSKT